MGEIFERALTIYVRNFRVFTLIALTLLLPLGIIDYILLPHSDAAMQAWAEAMQRRGAFSPQEIAGFIAVSCVFAFLSIVVQAAVAVAVATTYTDERPRYGEAFAAVARRFVTLLGVLVVEFALVLALYVVAIVVGVFIGLGGIAAGGVAHVGASLVVALVVIVLVTAFFAVQFVFALQFGIYGAVLEQPISPVAAVSEGIRRIYNRRAYPRAIVLTFVILGLGIAAAIFSAITGSLFGLAHVPSLTAVATTIVDVPFTAFNAILTAVFYFELRAPQPAPVLVPSPDEEPEPVYADTRYATGEERAMIYRFLAARDAMPAHERIAIAHDLAARVRPRVPPELQNLPDEALLERL
jgi:hypothetical protein